MEKTNSNPHEIFEKIRTHLIDEKDQRSAINFLDRTAYDQLCGMSLDGWLKFIEFRANIILCYSINKKIDEKIRGKIESDMVEVVRNPLNGESLMDINRKPKTDSKIEATKLEPIYAIQMFMALQASMPDFCKNVTRTIADPIDNSGKPLPSNMISEIIASGAFEDEEIARAQQIIDDLSPSLSWLGFPHCNSKQELMRIAETIYEDEAKKSGSRINISAWADHLLPMFVDLELLCFVLGAQLNYSAAVEQLLGDKFSEPGKVAQNIKREVSLVLDHKFTAQIRDKIARLQLI